MCKYVQTAAPMRLNVAEAEPSSGVTWHQRHQIHFGAHLFFTVDPFIVAKTSDIYAIGCQPGSATHLVKDGEA